MTRSNLSPIVFSILALGATPTLADTKPDDPWGPAADTEKCVKEFTKGTPEWINGSWLKFDKGKVKTPDNASAECKAEVDKRADACLKDSAMQARIAEARNKTPKQSSHAAILQTAGDDGPKLICSEESFQRMKRQRERAAYEKKFEEERAAKVAAAELPTRLKRDAAKEQMMTAAYKKESPNAKIVTVIVSSDWETVRNDFGVIIGRSFRGAVIDKREKQESGAPMPKEWCSVYEQWWRQEYIGGQFKGPVTPHDTVSNYEVLCSKVK